MKRTRLVLLCAISFLYAAPLMAQRLKSIRISVDRAHSTSFDEKEFDSSEYRKTIDSAFIIASAVLSSAEFQNQYRSLSFPYWNHCKKDECAPNIEYKGSEVFKGESIYDRIFKDTAVVWTLYLERSSWSSLGSTCPNTGYTTAYLKNIKKDMPKIPLAYAMAVNLCHEYMHQIGICHKSNSFDEPDNDHPDPEGYKNDIAYRVGWDCYYILKEWYDAREKIKGL